MRIIFSGPLRRGSTTLQRLTALTDLGHEVLGIDTYKTPATSDPSWFLERVAARAYRLGSPLPPAFRDRAGANAAIVKAVRDDAWDVLWIEKGVTIDASTLVAARQLRSSIRIVGYAPDDMWARHNHSRQFLDQLPFYDVFFTTKSFNLPELKGLGCPEVRFVDNSFDPHTHRPMTLSDDERRQWGGPIGFVGTYETERATSLAHLSSTGLLVRIYGNHWAREKTVSRLGLRVEGKAPEGDDYAKAICSFDINLNFLRKINRDLQTARSIEIPACGKFMMTERTEEHQALFEDGKEAVFFGSDDELLDLARYYLKRPDECRKIGLAGRERCLRAGYSHHDKMAKLLAMVLTLPR